MDVVFCIRYDWGADAMRWKTKTAVGIIIFVAIVTLFVTAMPSLMGLLLCVLLVVAVFDFLNRRYRQTARTFNSAAKTVCHQKGAMTKVATAFARSGALRGPCYEYARRLLVGQDPIESAAKAGVPLALTTAVAMTTAKSSPKEQGATRRNPNHSVRRLDLTNSSEDSNTTPIYAQILYVVTTALVTCGLLSFTGVFVVPAIEKMLVEFGLETTYISLMFGAPTQILLMIVVVVLLAIIPIVGLGSFFGIKVPRWFPVSPRVIEDRSDVLRGLADAIDAGMAVDQALLLGAKISLRYRESNSLLQASELIRQGTTPAVALEQTGWINAREREWLSGANASRGSQLLRTIAEERVRDAHANLRWLLGILFPCIVLLLGCAVLAYSFGFFSSLVELINGLS